MLLSIVLTLLSFCGAYILFVTVPEWRRHGPKGWPLLGTLPEVLSKVDRLYDDFFTAKFQQYGMTFYNRMLLDCTVFTVDPQDIRYMLENVDKFPQGENRRDVLQDFLGSGIFNADGHVWLLQRKTIVKEFTVSKFKKFTVDVFDEHVDLVSRRLASCARSGESVDFQELMACYTFDSIGKIAFGTDFNCLRAQSRGEALPEFVSAFDFANRRCYERFMQWPVWKLMRWLNVGSERQLRDAIATIDSFCYAVIAERRALPADELAAKCDLMSRFMALEEVDEGVPVTDKYLRDIILSVVLAGRDTTSNCASWLFYYLSANPRVEAKLRAALAEAGIDGRASSSSSSSSSSIGGEASYDAVMRMPYMRAVFSETLRLSPSVADDGHLCVEDCVLPSGHPIYAGEWASYVPYAQGRMPQLYGGDCLEFRPERWLDESGAFVRRNEFEYSVFQGGPRRCAGVTLARLEVSMLVAKLVPLYSISVDNPDQVNYDIALTLPIKGGLFVHIKEL
jgi:cytochrome P450